MSPTFLPALGQWPEEAVVEKGAGGGLGAGGPPAGQRVVGECGVPPLS